MQSAELIDESLPNWQRTTNLYRLSPPLIGNEYVAICVSTEPYCADDTTVFAATSTGGALADPETGRWWILAHYPDDTPHMDALQELGYKVTGSYSGDGEKSD